MAMTQGQCRGFFFFSLYFFFFFWFFLMRLSLSSFLPVVLCLSIERGPLDFALAPSVSVPRSGDCYIACALQRHVCEAGAPSECWSRTFHPVWVSGPLFYFGFGKPCAAVTRQSKMPRKMGESTAEKMFTQGTRTSQL